MERDDLLFSGSPCHFFLSGVHRAIVASVKFKTVNPYTNQELKEYSYHSLKETWEILKTLQETQNNWAELSPSSRGPILKNMASNFEAEKEVLARQASLEMGKPISSARAEVEKSIRALMTLAEIAPQVLKEKKVQAHYSETSIVPEPMGIIFSIQPWNFPYWQVLRMAATSLMAGNVILLKHSDQVAGCAELLEKICDRSEYQLLKSVRLTHENAARVIESPLVNMITFTGSTQGGRSVAQSAGRALKKCVLELGGSDAYIIMKDADLPNAIKQCALARLVNTGQSCVAGKRFFVHQDIKEKFLEGFLKAMKEFKKGDPLEEETQLGPLAQTRFHQQLLEQVERAAQLGAKLLIAQKEEAPFSPVGVLDFGPDLRGFEDQEIFGPMALLYEFDNVEDVIEVVNQGPFGLGGGVFTLNLQEAQRISSRVRVGSFAINTSTQSDPRLPFGGVRESGYGREMGIEGVMDFVSHKVIGRQ